MNKLGLGDVPKSRMLANEGFIAKAPANKIEEEKAKKVKYEELLQKTTEQLKKIKKISM